MNNLHDIELIERYFDNELSEQDAVMLHNRLKSDRKFRETFAQEKLLVSAIRYNGAQANLQYLRELEKTLNSANSSASRTWYYYAAAACISLLVLAGIFLPMGNQTTDELYSAYFEPYPNVFSATLRSPGSVTDRRSEAFEAYEAGDYLQAAALFTGLMAEHKDPGMLLLLGNANLAIGKTDDAMKNFSDLLTEFDDLDIQAKWFLSLCHLKNGDTEKASELLRELEGMEISYATRARELLKKVE